MLMDECLQRQEARAILHDIQMVSEHAGKKDITMDEINAEIRAYHEEKTIS